MATFIGGDTVDDDHFEGTEQIQYGLGGDDSLISADDVQVVLYGGEGNDALFSDSGNDELYGGRGNDLLGGGTGSNFLEAGSGDDQISVGQGTDLVFGGRGADTFFFAADISELKIVRIQDFSRKEGDSIKMDGASFLKLNAGEPLDPDLFFKGKKALEADDHLGYDKASGKLYYDENGSKHGGSHLIAVFDKGTQIKISDIDVGPIGVG